MVDETTTETTTETEVEMVPKATFLARVAEEKSKRDTLQASYNELESKSQGWQALATVAETSKTRVAELEAQLQAREQTYKASTTMLKAGVEDDDMQEFLLTKHSKLPTQEGVEPVGFEPWFETQKEKPFLSPFLRGAATQTDTKVEDTTTTATSEGSGAEAGKNGVTIKPDITGGAAAAPRTGNIATEGLKDLGKSEWDAVRRDEIKKAFQR